MPELATMSVVGVIVAVILVIVFLKVRQKDLLGEMIKKRQAAAKIVSRAEYVEGVNKIPVALSVVQDTIYYENPDLEASFDLDRIDEIEYTDELAIGRTLDHGHHALRLRSHGHTFEFVLEPGDEKKWLAVLPPHSYEQPARAV
jgi:hypothetical protein